MSKWTIQTFDHDLKRWKSVKESIDKVWRKKTGQTDTHMSFEPRSLEECIIVLKSWYEELDAGGFSTKGPLKAADWQYRIKKLRSREFIPGDLFR